MKKFPVIFKIFLAILASLLVFFLMEQNAFLYQEPVAEVLSAEITESKSVTDIYQNKDTEITQKLTLQLLNGDKERIQLSNQVSESQLAGQIYREGQKLILREASTGYQILELKRDALIAALFTFFVALLFIFVSFKSSSFLLLSLFLNLIYFTLAVAFNLQMSLSIFLVFGLLALVFIFSSSLFVLGANRQMLYSSLTTLFTMFLTFLILFLVLTLTNNSGVHFEYLSFVTQSPSELFFMTCIIAVLGAVMVQTGDVVIGLFGLYRQNQINHQEKSMKDYFKSGMSIGREAVGAQTNILFMVFMAEVIPKSVLLLSNGNSLSFVLSVELNLGLLQTLISGIGIVLAVPVSALITSFGMTKLKPEKEVEARR